MAYGHLAVEESIKKVFYSCTMCGVCDTICPRPLVDTVRAMREEIKTTYPELYPEAIVKRSENILTKHNFFAAKAEARGHWKGDTNVPQGADTVYFAGCYASYRHQATARAVVKLLEAAGQKVAILGEEEWCCGQTAGLAGDWALEEEMARHNVDCIRKMGAKRVIFSCPECYRAFTVDYPQMVGRLPFATSHVVQVYEESIREKSCASGERRKRPSRTMIRAPWFDNTSAGTETSTGSRGSSFSRRPASRYTRWISGSLCLLLRQRGWCDERGLPERSGVVCPGARPSGCRQGRYPGYRLPPV